MVTPRPVYRAIDLDGTHDNANCPGVNARINDGYIQKSPMPYRCMLRSIASTGVIWAVRFDHWEMVTGSRCIWLMEIRGVRPDEGADGAVNRLYKLSVRSCQNPFKYGRTDLEK